MTPARIVAPNLIWEGMHLYQEWPGPSKRRRYVGSIVRECFLHDRRWSIWKRGEHLGRYSDERRAREGLEEHAREDRS